MQSRTITAVSQPKQCVKMCSSEMSPLCLKVENNSEANSAFVDIEINPIFLTLNEEELKEIISIENDREELGLFL